MLEYRTNNQYRKDMVKIKIKCCLGFWFHNSLVLLLHIMLMTLILDFEIKLKRNLYDFLFCNLRFMYLSNSRISL